MKRKLGKRQRESTNSIKKILDGAMKGLYNVDTTERFCSCFAKEDSFCRLEVAFLVFETLGANSCL